MVKKKGESLYALIDLFKMFICSLHPCISFFSLTYPLIFFVYAFFLPQKSIKIDAGYLFGKASENGVFRGIEIRMGEHLSSNYHHLINSELGSESHRTAYSRMG